MEFRDLKKQYNKYQDEIGFEISKVLNSANFISGDQVKELEKKMAEYVGVEHCITCANGTDALILVLKAWEISTGDAVFVPNFTFFATAEVVESVGATPIFVDVDEKTFNMDSAKLELAIQKIKREKKYVPKAIIPVDLFGLPASYNDIDLCAKRHKMLILEDAAQGFGGSISGKMSGSFGDAATTSFFPAKPLGCYGDGGAIFTNNSQLAEMIESLKVHGKGLNKYDNVRIGVNSRLDTMQAAILKVKFNAFVNHELDDVNRVAQLYSEKLYGIVEVPEVPDNYVSSWAQYTIKLPNKEIRDGLKMYLDEHSIPSMVYYLKTLHKQKAFEYLQISDANLSVSIDLCDRVLSLPMHPYLTNSDVDYIVETISCFMTKVNSV